MTGRWSSSNRRAELPDDWPAIVKAVMRRAGRQCEKRLPSGARCPRHARDVDHRDDPHDHSMRNLQALCADHHKAKTAREAFLARGKRPAPARPRAEQHPGIVVNIYPPPPRPPKHRRSP